MYAVRDRLVSRKIWRIIDENEIENVEAEESIALEPQGISDMLQLD
jgi:hypothetical protein